MYAHEAHLPLHHPNAAGEAPARPGATPGTPHPSLPGNLPDAARLTDLLQRGSVWACAAPTGLLPHLTAFRRSKLEALLPKAAGERLSRFTNRDGRMQSAAARLLAWGALRMVFGTLWTASAHNAWRERPPFGPTLDTPAGTIQVTLAHTAGSVACAFSLRPAGLDIERIRDVARMRTIAARHARAVIPLIDEALSEAAARRHFFKAWGLVESAVKMSRDGRAVAVADQLRDGELRLADNLGQCLTGAFEELPPNDDAPLGTILTAVPAAPRETGATVLFSIFGSTFFEMLLRQERD